MLSVELTFEIFAEVFSQEFYKKNVSYFLELVQPRNQEEL